MTALPPGERTGLLPDTIGLLLQRLRDYDLAKLIKDAEAERQARKADGSWDPAYESLKDWKP